MPPETTITAEVAQRLDRDLDGLLEMLRAGDLDGLREAVRRIEAALGGAGGASPDLAPTPAASAPAEVLARLRRKAERNAACLKGAARGLRAARRRIAEVRAAAEGHGAYDAGGRRLDPAAAGARISRRL